VETFLIKRDEPMRPRRKDRGRIPQSLSSTTSVFTNYYGHHASSRTPNLILNAGLLASALTSLNELDRHQEQQQNNVHRGSNSSELSQSEDTTGNSHNHSVRVFIYCTFTAHCMEYVRFLRAVTFKGHTTIMSN
jgi:hypothetical protein